MTIKTSIPSSLRRPGRFGEFNIASAARGLVPVQNRIALIGIMSAAATATAATPYQIFSESEADTLFGVGSELALMCRWGIKGARDYGSAPEIWAVGMAEATTKAVQTLTVTGPATAAGEIVLAIAGRIVRVAVASGAVQNDIATAIDSAIDALKAELPVTSGVATNVVTLTNVVKGVVGNDVQFDVPVDGFPLPAGVAIVSAQSVAGAGAADITASLDVLEDKDYDIVVCGNHTSTDIADFATHLTTTWNPAAKRWRFSMLAERGSLATAQALATAADDYKQMVVSAEGYRNLCGEIAAYVAATLAGESDPALPWNDVALPSLYLPAKSQIPTNAELESGIAGGLFMLSVNAAQTQAKIVRAVTTKVTHSSVPFFNLLDFTIPRSMVYGARQIIFRQEIAFPRAKKNDRTKDQIRSEALQVAEELEALEIWQNIEEHAAEFQVEDDSAVPSRVNVAIPASVVPPLNQIANVFNLLVE